MAESTQHKLDRVRPPRVQITYDVETGGAIVKTELPLVVGVMADLSGRQTDLDNKPRLKELKERKFIEIDRDNFDDVLKKSDPRLSLSAKDDGVADSDGNKVFPVKDLAFEKLDDFKPYEVVSRVDALKALYDSRNRLADLAAKLDGNVTLEDLLRKAISDSLSDLESLPDIEALPQLEA